MGSHAPCVHTVYTTLQRAPRWQALICHDQPNRMCIQPSAHKVKGKSSSVHGDMMTTRQCAGRFGSCPLHGHGVECWDKHNLAIVLVVASRHHQIPSQKCWPVCAFASISEVLARISEVRGVNLHTDQASVWMSRQARECVIRQMYAADAH